MKKYKISFDEKFITTSEAYYGNFVVNKNKVAIPYCNIFLTNNIMDNIPSDRYLNFCYLIFDDVSFIAWDYESKSLLGKNSECYGGENFFVGNYSEFWISYNNCNLILIDDISEYSNEPYSKIDEKNFNSMQIFFKSVDANKLF